MNAQTHRHEMEGSLSIAWLAFCGVLFGFAGVSTGVSATEYMATSVAARADKSYVRARDDDGHFKPEYFAFGEGGRWNGPMQDLSIDRLSFEEVAHTVAPSFKIPEFSSGHGFKEGPAVDHALLGHDGGTGWRIEQHCVSKPGPVESGVGACD